MQFPEWAPSNLIDEYHDLNREPELYFDKERRAILIQLTTSCDREKIWKRLYEKRRHYPCDDHKPKSFGNDNMAWRLYSEIERAWRESEREHPTRAEDAQKYQTIAKTARELARAMRGSLLDDTPYRWYPLKAINTIIKKDIKPEKLAGLFCLAQDESDFHKKCGIYAPVNVQLHDGTEITEHWRLYEDTEDLFERRIVTPQYPVMSQILTTLALDADKLAHDSMTEPRLVDRPTINKRTIFIRALSKFWLDEFGTPLYRTFAALCSVVLNDPDISGETVKDALKAYKLMPKKGDKYQNF
jgi:hypothetical protein